MRILDAVEKLFLLIVVSNIPILFSPKANITVRKGSDDGAIKGRHATFELTGSDHPGIIRDISSALATNGVSIHKLETSVSPGSMSGEPIFTANAEIILPEGMRVRDLRGRLEQIAHDLLVDITLTESADATD